MSQQISPTAEPGTAVRYLSRTSEAPVEGSPGHRPSTRTLDLDAAEQAVVGHMRGWCHDSTVCALCTAWDARNTLRQDLIRAQAHGRDQELRRVDTEINNAHLAREVMRLTDTLDSIIEG